MIPEKIGVGSAFVLGLFVDVLYADPIGLNGFILAGVTFIAWRFFERLRMYSVFQQCGLIFVLAFLAELLSIFVIGLGSARQWSWSLLFVPLVTMVIWPPMFLVLLRIRTGIRVE